jgi:serine/threonine protein kinase/cytochrome c-type biogenesis protein CcmH/NrfG
MQDSSLFGEMAVERGFLTSPQLEEALARQQQEPNSTLGQIMVALGFLTQPQVNGIEKLGRVLASEKKRAESSDEEEEVEITGLTLGGCLILDRLGVGNMGTAFRAHHLRLDRDVVIKVLHPRMVAVEGYLDRFAREARAAAILEHPAIVSVYDFDSEHGYHFIVMQYVKGQDLRRVLLSRGAMGVRRGLWVAARTLEGLAHAHGKGLVHRDIKPDNLLITPEPRIKIADFGLVRRMTGTTGDEISMLGEIIGTPQYMAPEQASGAGEVDHRVDLYSLGITTFELICGRPPFQGNSTLEVLEKHILEPLPKIGPMAPKEEITPQLQAFLERFCHKDPDERFGTCHEALEALQALRQRGTTTRFAPVNDPSRLDDATPVVSEEDMNALMARLKRSQSFVAFESEDEDDEEESSNSDGQTLVEQSFEGLEVQSSELARSRRRLAEAARDPERLVPELLHDLLKEGHVDELLALTKEFEATLPTSPAVPFFVAQAHERKGDLEEARGKLALATVFAPDHLPARLHLARILVTLKRVDEAIQTLQEAARWHSNSAKTAVRLAEVLYVVKGDPEAAVPAYERAIQLAPARWKLRIQLAWILHELKRNERAEAVLQEVIAWKPDADAAHKLLKRVRKKLKKKQKLAAVEAPEETETGPDGPGPRTSACLQAIRLSSASNKHERSLELAEEGLKDRPQSVPLLVAKAAALVSLGRLSDAVSVYGTAIAIDPHNEAANQGLLETQAARRSQQKTGKKGKSPKSKAHKRKSEGKDKPKKDRGKGKSKKAAPPRRERKGESLKDALNRDKAPRPADDEA